MDKIKRIIQIGSFENEEWNNEGQLYVFFEDESIDPEVIDSEEAYTVYESLAEQQGIVVGEDGTELGQVIVNAIEDETLSLCNKLNQAELDAANAALEAARKRAVELRKGKTPVEEVPEEEIDDSIDDSLDDDIDETQDLEEEVTAKKHTGLKVAAGVLAGVAALGGLHHLFSALNQNENNKDVDKDQDKDVDFDNGTFEELMNSMDENDPRRVTAEKAMELVNTFHSATHKDGNFRVQEDGNTYLDLSFEEALVLTTFTNNVEPEELYEILGDFGISAEQAKDTLESARNKLIAYYMNAIEPSGLAELFENEQDRQFFINMESSVLNFNAMHTTETSDQVIRNVYYNYVLDHSVNAAELSPMARLLGYDAVYGSLNLTESATVGHTQFLEFHGMSAEEETRYYVTNVLNLDYDSLSEDEIAKYRNNIIESGTDLVSLLANGQVMTSENATQEEMDANVSLTELVDKMGICNSVNAEIDEKMDALDKMASNKASVVEVQITNANSHIVEGLRDAGLDNLANTIEANISKRMSDELLKQVRASGNTGADLVEDYETRIDAISGNNRPSMQQIANAADRDLSQKTNYAGSLKDVSTLINNRRHTYEHNLTGEDLEKDNGIIGRDENDIPIFDETVLDGMTEEEKDQFIIENGTVIEEEKDDTPVIKEEVKEEDLTEEEVIVVNQQKVEEYIAEQVANGKVAAEDYKFRSDYTFANGTVTNPINGEVYNLNEMEFGSAVIRAQAFANASLDSDNELVRNGDFYIDADQDEQILNAARVSAENYINGLSQETKDEIVKASGLSWEEIKDQLIEGYATGYVTQMQVEIDALIAEGNNVFELTKNVQHDINEKNKANELVQDEETDTYVADEAADVVPDASEEEVVLVDRVEDVEVTDDAVVVPEGGSTTSGSTTETGEAPSGSSTEADIVEEDDWLIGGGLADEEVLVEDANGNKVNSTTAEEDLEALVHAAYEAMLNQGTNEMENAPVKTR